MFTHLPVFNWFNRSLLSLTVITEYWWDDIRNTCCSVWLGNTISQWIEDRLLILRVLYGIFLEHFVRVRLQIVHQRLSFTAAQPLHCITVPQLVTHLNLWPSDPKQPAYFVVLFTAGLYQCTSKVASLHFKKYQISCIYYMFSAKKRIESWCADSIQWWITRWRMVSRVHDEDYPVLSSLIMQTSCDKQKEVSGIKLTK